MYLLYLNMRCSDEHLFCDFFWPWILNSCLDNSYTCFKLLGSVSDRGAITI